MNNSISNSPSWFTTPQPQPQEIKLKEIIWEFTSKCNKNCSYCGSKDIMNNGKNFFDPIKICKDILEVAPEDLVFSGGEPAIQKSDLLTCVKFIKSSNENIKIKILTNGKFFELTQSEQQLFDGVGWSINTLEDMDDADNTFETYGVQIDKHKLAMVLNVGTHNLKDLEKLFQFALKRFAYLQVQLTMGEFQLNCDQIQEFLKTIETYIGFSSTAKTLGIFDLQIFQGDNMNTSPCSAGITSLGITHDGIVIGCLAQRSFMKIIPEGNLGSDTLKEIWENRFQKYRQSEYVKICCKDCTGIAKCIVYFDYAKFPQVNPNYNPNVLPTPSTNPNNVYVYGVNIPSSTCIGGSTVTYSLSNTGAIGGSLLIAEGPSAGY